MADLQSLTSLNADSKIKLMQDSLCFLAEMPKPVIVAVQGRSIGAALDLIAACDIRLATKDATFCLKEIDLGIVPDLGVLQRIKSPLMLRYALTGEVFDSERASQMGLITDVFADVQEMMQCAYGLALELGLKNSTVLSAIKGNVRDSSVQNGLDHARHFNVSKL